MKRISAAKLEELRNAGKRITPGKMRGIIPAKAHADKAVDKSQMLIKSVNDVSKVLLIAMDKVKNINESRNVREWNVSVIRGKDNLIQSVNLKAV